MDSVGVTVASASPGFTPVAFLAVVEVIDPDGEKYYEIVTSDGVTDARKDRLRSALSQSDPH